MLAHAITSDDVVSTSVREGTARARRWTLPMAAWECVSCSRFDCDGDYDCDCDCNGDGDGDGDGFSSTAHGSGSTLWSPARPRPSVLSLQFVWAGMSFARPQVRTSARGHYAVPARASPGAG